ncbi:MAG: L,D-transpeptidase family protein [Rhizobiaceae bacterium]
MRFPVLVSAAPILTFLAALSPVSVAKAETVDEPLQIVVSLNEQSIQVFRGNMIVAQSNVSSGKPGHSTPTGIFSILHKKKFHRSNIYSGAPMPFMQRLTWTGIALHESNSVPSYPASHGCVRLPAAFAQELYGITNVGGHVMITNKPVTPTPVNHVFLPQPELERQFDPHHDQWRDLYEWHAQRGTVMVDNPAFDIATARLLEPLRAPADMRGAEQGKLPPRILITRQLRQDVTTRVQQLLNRLGYDAGLVDGAIGPDSQAAIRRFQEASNMVPDGRLTPEVIDALHKMAGEEIPTNAKLMVRQDFQPVFEAPITIEQPEIPLGTHLLIATGNSGEGLQWNSFTLENRLGDNARALYGISRDASDDVGVWQALNRLQISQDLRAFLSRIVRSGASIAISDGGSERYTGWNTDFAITTRPEITRSGSANLVAKVQGGSNRQTNNRSVVRVSNRKPPAQDRNLPGVRRIAPLPGLWLAR